MGVLLRQEYTGNTYPEVITERTNGRTIKYVPYVISEVDNMFTWEYVPLRISDYNYPGLVNALIGLKYDLSETLAIMNNYMYEPTNETYKKEFIEFQEWRKTAKTYAKKYFNIA